jgi:hypothetical protein
MRFTIVGLFLTLSVTPSSAKGQNSAESTLCAVTVPTAADAYGTRELSVWLGWRDGTVVFRPGGPGFVLPDGALSMKFGWERGVRGHLTLEGHRLDAPAPPLRANIPRGYGDIGFQSTAIIFPTPGCWEVTGQVGNATLTFVTRVVQIGAGPGVH